MRFLIRLFLIGFSSLAAAESPFETGLKSYEDGDYAAAIKAFETQVGVEETGAVRHNLALAHYQLGQPAEAVWQLERALRLAPHNEAYQYKLAALRGQLGLPPGEPDWWMLLSQALSPGAWVLLLAGSFWIFLGTLLLPCFAGRPLRLPGRVLILLSCLGLILGGTALLLQRNLAHSGICLTENPTELRAAPAAAAPQTGIARPGERARPLERHNAYVKVRTEGGAEGWIEETKFRSIKP
jgi:tetratricopeptide (TPR) repeat protein